jgi:hypothetical protein
MDRNPLMQQKSEEMRMLRNRINRVLGLTVGLTVACAGCQQVVEDVAPPKNPNYPAVEQPQAAASAGVLPVPVAQPTVVVDLVRNYKLPQPRRDPFSLQELELAYETKQANARIFATTGAFFPSLFVPKEERVEVDFTEPQPYRRLAGVLVGDSVMAIIDMGDGRPMEVIRPGMQIPNSPWRVISIDEEKAVLKRSGNVKPKEIVVRLETPGFSRPSAPAGGNAGAAGRGGQNANPGGAGRRGAGAGAGRGRGAGNAGVD